MRWEKIASFTENEEYRLTHQQKNILSLRFHPFSNSARLDCEDEKRVFQFRREGFRRHKTVVRNEYGVKVCELLHEQDHNYLIHNEEKYEYQVRNNMLQLFREDDTIPVLQCELENRQTISGSVPAGVTPCLLLAISWYLQHSEVTV